MSYNTKEKPICSCTRELTASNNSLLKSSNKKVFLSNTVILLTFEEYMYKC